MCGETAASKASVPCRMQFLNRWDETRSSGKLNEVSLSMTTASTSVAEIIALPWRWLGVRWALAGVD